MTISTAIHDRLAEELGVDRGQIDATVALFDDGATVPFVARYRKEVTGGLDDVQLRRLDERLRYLRELEERRATVLKSIEEQGKLDDALRAQILAADTKTRLEDLYLPFRPKRRTKAMIAEERGLAPLAEALLADPTLDPETQAATFVDAEREVPDGAAALEGARHILVERFCEDAELVGQLREWSWEKAELRVELVDEDQRIPGQKFRDWFDHQESLHDVPSHRALAFLRGRKDGVLRLRLRLHEEDRSLSDDSTGIGAHRIAERFGISDAGRPADTWLVETARSSWATKMSLHLETELLSRLRGRSEEDAIDVFAKNLHALLLAAPAGPKCILGLDPGLRTGVKVAVVDGTGKVLATDTVFPTPPREDVEGTITTLTRLIEEHDVELISVGNGTGSRETDRCVTKLVRKLKDRKLQKVVTNEAGASVYSASELASRELGALDVSLRGAVSIARRLQDPLAELVKIEPRSIGVGQYQHDVDQNRLARSLDGVVEDCVNSVGVDVNTASTALLSHVAGLTTTIAENLVAHRDHNGPFKNRKELLEISRLGPKAFEQAAGFLRVSGGEDPLDASGVHPEAYDVVRRIESETGKGVAELIGDQELLQSLDPAKFTDETFGEPTVRDILGELEKPGRDPRPEFRGAALKEGVEDISDLKPGMTLEGTVTNVTKFGAFIDVGVHQDGLVHVSRMAEEFVRSPHDVVSAGQVVKVKVLEVDPDRERVALSMRMSDEPGVEPKRVMDSGNERGPKPQGGQKSQGGRGRRGGRGRSDDRDRRGGRDGRRPAKGAGPGADNEGAKIAREVLSREEQQIPNAFARAFAKLKEEDKK